jgi:hypothetical protein
MWRERRPPAAGIQRSRTSFPEAYNGRIRRDIALIVLAAWPGILPATTLSQTPLATETVACGDSRIATPKQTVTVAELGFRR